MAEKQPALKQAPQVRPDLPAWHRAAPLMPSRESGDGGGGMDQAERRLAARYQDEPLRLWYVWKANQQGSLGQLLNSEEQSKFNEGSFLICSQTRERYSI